MDGCFGLIGFVGAFLIMMEFQGKGAVVACFVLLVLLAAIIHVAVHARRLAKTASLPRSGAMGESAIQNAQETPAETPDETPGR